MRVAPNSRWPADLEHVLWIGGPPASGKTTIATRLARRHGLRLYTADTRTWEHRDRAVRAGNPAAVRWEAMTPRERWETATPADMLAMSLHRERGSMVVDDLRALPRSPLVVAEGTTLPASAVPDRSRAVWLLPTREFQEAELQRRRLSRGRRELFLLHTERIRGEAAEHDLPTLVVDRSHGLDAAVEAVERLLADALDEGPRAERLAERRALLREANEAIVAQLRGYYARPWADGNAEEVVRTFHCECGDLSCELGVDVRVGEAAAGCVLAAGHV
jgi:hypothetical protein